MSRVEKIGRRHYLRGTPFAAKDQIRSAGCKWDPAEKSWWTAKADVAAELVASLSSSSSSSSESAPDAPGLDATVAGRAEYKGRTYYVAARSGRYDDERPEPVTSRDGARILLYFRDGSRQFWAARAAARVVKGYSRGQTIRSLRDYAERAERTKAERATPSTEPVGPAVCRAQGKTPYERDEVLIARLTAIEIAECEARQGLSAAIAGAPDERGKPQVVCVVAWARSLSDDDVEEQDAWSHQHTAVLRLATADEAAPIVAARGLEERRAAAVVQVAEIVGALPRVESLEDAGWEGV